MKLKLLFVPLIAVLIVYMIILHVIPAYFGAAGISATKEDLQKINAKVADIESKRANAAELASALNYNANQQIIIRRYLPEEKRDEEVINSLSSMASDNDVSISSVTVGADLIAPAIDEAVAVAPVKPVAVSANTVTDMVDVPSEKLLQKFDVKVKTVGSYENIKELILDLTKLERFNEITSLKITAVPENEELFIADMSIAFNYVRKLTSVFNVDKKIFADKNFDMNIVADIENTTSAEVSPVTVGDLGRTNPFAL